MITILVLIYFIGLFIFYGFAVTLVQEDDDWFIPVAFATILWPVIIPTVLLVYIGTLIAYKFHRSINS